MSGSVTWLWTEERCHEVLDDLEQWLFATKPKTNKKEEIIRDENGEVIMVDAGNCFWSMFLFEKKLNKNWIYEVKNKYPSVKERIEFLKDVQEEKLQWMAFEGRGKEGMAKFILQNKYNWREKSETKNQTEMSIVWNEERTYETDSQAD